MDHGCLDTDSWSENVAVAPTHRSNSLEGSLFTTGSGQWKLEHEPADSRTIWDSFSAISHGHLTWCLVLRKPSDTTSNGSRQLMLDASILYTSYRYAHFSLGRFVLTSLRGTRPDPSAAMTGRLEGDI
ncbi:hypothetical protein PM082_017653 [Marasmius tenuissimus]|nr:hypothetical protein PM082_017653 [Marasmius tenuissimus]